MGQNKTIIPLISLQSVWIHNTDHNYGTEVRVVIMLLYIKIYNQSIKLEIF